MERERERETRIAHFGSDLVSCTASLLVAVVYVVSSRFLSVCVRMFDPVQLNLHLGLCILQAAQAMERVWKSKVHTLGVFRKTASKSKERQSWIRAEQSLVPPGQALRSSVREPMAPAQDV